MPLLNSLVDILYTDLALGELGRAETQWPSTWEEVSRGKAWESWLLHGKMTLARAEIALRLGQMEPAAEWAATALADAVRTRRRKYEGNARALMGQIMLATGRADEGVRSEERRGGKG